MIVIGMGIGIAVNSDVTVGGTTPTVNLLYADFGSGLETIEVVFNSGYETIEVAPDA